MNAAGRKSFHRIPITTLVQRWIGVVIGLTVLVLLIVTLTTGSKEPSHPARTSHRPVSRAQKHDPAAPSCPGITSALPGMPPVTDPCNVYSADASGALSPVARSARPLIYVPNSLNDSVDEIDPTTYKVVRSSRSGPFPNTSCRRGI